MRTSLVAATILAAVFATTVAAQTATTIVTLNPNDALRDARAALAEGRLEAAASAAARLTNEPRRHGDGAHALRLRYDARSILCVVRRLQQRFEQALEHCDAAIALDSRDWRGYVNRGGVHFEAGDAVAALRDFTRAERMAPGEPAVAANLALVRRALAAAQNAAPRP